VIFDVSECGYEAGNQHKVEVDRQLREMRSQFGQVLLEDDFEELDVCDDRNHIDVVVIGHQSLENVANHPEGLLLGKPHFEEEEADEVHPLAVSDFHISF